MTFSLTILLYLYFVFVIIWAILSLVGIMHIIRYSAINIGSVSLIFVYAIGSIIILSISGNFMKQIDWKTEITIFKNINSVNDLIKF